jgi:hypothetical protein
VEPHPLALCVHHPHTRAYGEVNSPLEEMMSTVRCGA